LVKPAEIAGASIEALLENLQLPEYRSRYRTLRELRGRKAEEVLPALEQWLAKLEPTDPQFENLRLQVLWATWGANQVDVPLLKTILQSPDYHARAAAVRVLRYHLQLPDAQALLQAAANDEHGRVRLEAIIAATWLGDSPGIAIAESASAKIVDEWISRPLQTTLQRLKGTLEIIVDPHPAPPPPDTLSASEKAQYLEGHKIYFRDAHCATCHQPDGKGIAPAFPSLSESSLIRGNKDRLIKIVLYGLIGPYEVNGKKHDGLVPMTAFKDLLNDAEAAAVMTYVRNSFGNQSPAITAEEVAKVRQNNSGKTDYYKVEDLLQQHPIE